MNISINSVFTPLTYADFMAPVKDYMEVYKEEEAKYETLSDMAETWKYEVNQQGNNKEAYKLFRSFDDEFSVKADAFSNGLNVTNRGDYLKLKRSYNENITPIIKADEKRKADQEYRDKIKATDPTAFFKEYDDEDPGLDNYLPGKSVSKEYYSGKQLEAETAEVAKKAAYSLFDKVNAVSAVKGEYFDLQVLQGMPFDEITAVLENKIDEYINDPNLGMSESQKESLRKDLNNFKKVIDKQYARFENYGETAKQKAYDSIYRGAMQAAQQTIHNFQTDPTNARKFQASESAKDRASNEKIAAGHDATQIKTTAMNNAAEDRRLEKSLKYAKGGGGSRGNSDSDSGSDKVSTLNSPVKIYLANGHPKFGKATTLEWNDGNIEALSKEDYELIPWESLNGKTAHMTKRGQKSGDINVQTMIKRAIGKYGDPNEYNFYYNWKEGDMIIVPRKLQTGLGNGINDIAKFLNYTTVGN